MSGVLYRDRHMQHRSGLAVHQLGRLQNVSIGEFQRVVLNVPIVHIDLPEAGNLVIHMGLAKKTEGAVVPDFVIERQFRSGQKTNRDFGWTVMNYELGTVLPD